MTELPAAFCAPGATAEAAEVLARAGEAVEKITEHPWLKGFPGVLIVDPSAFEADPPYRVRLAGTAVRRLDLGLEHFRILTESGGESP